MRDMYRSSPIALPTGMSPDVFIISAHRCNSIIHNFDKDMCLYSRKSGPWAEQRCMLVDSWTSDSLQI